MSDTNDFQLSIGKFARTTCLSQRALRIYEKKELLIPKRDDFNNYRYYSSNQIETGLRIRLLIWMGFGLEEVREILQALQNYPENFQFLDQKFNKKLHETELEIERLKMVKEILRGKKAIEILSMNITTPEIKNIPEMRVLTKRETGPIQQTVGKLFGEIMQDIYHPDNQRGQVSINGTPFLIYHDLDLNMDLEDQEFDAENGDFECGIPISGKVNVNEKSELKSLPAVRVVSVIHTGSYSQVHSGYAEVYEYLRKNKLKIAGPSRELYLNNPEEVPEEKLLTEIQFPIK